MARKRELFFFRHKQTGNWIAGIDANGRYEYSPKMCDAMLFFWMQASGVSTQEHKREYVITRAFHPPRPRMWRPKSRLRAKPKAKSTKTAKTSLNVSTEVSSCVSVSVTA